MRTLFIYFDGGNQAAIQTEVEPSRVYEALTGEDRWLVVEDSAGDRHYMAVDRIAYLTFGDRKGIGFA